MKTGDEEAVSCLWRRYFQRMRACARDAAKGFVIGAGDDEDMAAMAFQQFSQGLEQGRFSELMNRNQLWKLLAVITVRTTQGSMGREMAQKRGGDRRAVAEAEIATHPDRAPSPRAVSAANDELSRLLESLDDNEFQEVALLSMEGYSTSEIAHQIGSTQRTVQRMLVVIRETWSASLDKNTVPVDEVI